MIKDKLKLDKLYTYDLRAKLIDYKVEYPIEKTKNLI